MSDRDEAIRLYTDRTWPLNQKEIGERLGVSETTVGKWLKAAGIPKRMHTEWYRIRGKPVHKQNRRGIALTPELRARVLALLDSGATMDSAEVLALVPMGKAIEIEWQARGWKHCPQCGASTTNDLCEMCEREEQRELDAELVLWPMRGTFRVKNEHYLEAG